MTKIASLHRRCLLLMLLLFILDQLTKQWAMAGDVMGAYVAPFFNLVQVWNDGVSFGLLSHRGEWMEFARLGLIAMTAAILVGLAVWLRRTHVSRTAYPIALVIGGAAGNLVDRIRHGAVFDFLDFHAMGYHWPAFNLADGGIVIGVLLLCLDSLLRKDGPP